MQNLTIRYTCAIGWLFSISTTCAASEYHCGNFAGYAARADLEIDSNKWLSEGEKRQGKIDKHIAHDELSKVFDCVQKQASNAIELLFNGRPFHVDPALYQFAFSDFAYGRVLVDEVSYPAYLDERIQEGMTILKLTFNFDENSHAVTEDVFAARVVGGTVEYSEYLNGKFEIAARCYSCHRAVDRGGLFFKSRFTGYKFSTSE